MDTILVIKDRNRALFRRKDVTRTCKFISKVVLYIGYDIWVSKYLIKQLDSIISELTTADTRFRSYDTELAVTTRQSCCEVLVCSGLCQFTILDTTSKRIFSNVVGVTNILGYRFDIISLAMTNYSWIFFIPLLAVVVLYAGNTIANIENNGIEKPIQSESDVPNNETGEFI